MKSLWNDTVKMPEFPTLDHDISTDILIIGGGMAGILTAYLLDKKGVDYCLVEGSKICGGTTLNTTAKITAQHGAVFSEFLSTIGKERTEMYLEANLKAAYFLKKLCIDIDCDFCEKDNYVYSLNNREKLEDELWALDSIGFKAELCEELPLPFKTVGAVRFRKQAQFNPLKFISEISKNLNIYENTFVNTVKNGFAYTEKNKIKAKKIIIATHFPFINRHGSYFLKLYQHRSYVLGLENTLNLRGMYVDENMGGLSFRNYGNLLLLGGGSHRTGKKGGGYNELREFTKNNLPGANEVYHFAAQDCMTLDKIPYIGNYSAFCRDIYVATGFNKWGMTGSMLSALMLSEMVLERSNPYEALFSPSRSIFKPQLAINAFEAFTNVITFRTPRCTHLGCALKWNSHEHTWDCACHGSRFAKDGKVIENPAKKNLF